MVGATFRASFLSPTRSHDFFQARFSRGQPPNGPCTGRVSRRRRPQKRAAPERSRGVPGAVRQGIWHQGLSRAPIMIITFAPPLTGKVAFSSSSAPSTFRTATASSKIFLSRARPVLGEHHVMRAGQLSRTSHRRWIVPVARTAPDGEKRASTVVTHHSPRAQHEATIQRTC